jgi:hypothetical protein
MTPTTPSPISQAAVEPVAWLIRWPNGNEEVFMNLAVATQQAAMFRTKPVPLGVISTAPTTGSAPEMIRFDFINADGNEDSKVISHDEMRERYADMHRSANSAFAAPASPEASALTDERILEICAGLELKASVYSDVQNENTLRFARALLAASMGGDPK